MARRDSSVVVINLESSLFVEVDYGRIFALLRYYFLIPHTAEKAYQLLYYRATTMLAYFGRDGICTRGFSSRELLDCLLDFFLAGWSVEIGVCLNLWQAGNSFGVDICLSVEDSTTMSRMAGLFVISGVSSTLSNGDVPDDCGP